jgi:hypothetical protein
VDAAVLEQDCVAVAPKQPPALGRQLERASVLAAITPAFVVPVALEDDAAIGAKRNAVPIADDL